MSGKRFNAQEDVPVQTHKALDGLRPRFSCSPTFLRTPRPEEVSLVGYMLYFLSELCYSHVLPMATEFCSERQRMGFLINNILTEDT